jgi:hypothetical protein
VGPNAAGVETTIAALEAEGRLTDTHSALVAAVRQLAAAVDSAPDNASLWREYRAALASLMEAESGGDDDDTQTFLLALRTPVGDGKNARPKDTRTRSSGGGGAARTAPDAVAKDGRRRRT